MKNKGGSTDVTLGGRSIARGRNWKVLCANQILL